MGNQIPQNEKKEKNIKKDKIERVKFQSKYLHKDQITEILESLTPKALRKPFSHFIIDYKIKKNIKCQKDPIYTIKVVENIRSGRLFNLKVLRKNEVYKIGIDTFKSIYQSELTILEQIKNPNVENIINIYFDEMRNSEIALYMITVYTHKYSLLDYCNKYIQERKKFTLKDIAIIMKLLLEITYKMKTCGILYRNFSLENIFFFKENNFFTLCLRNFYFCTIISPNQTTRGVYGSLYYLAPEVVKELPYEFKSDIWSLGLILYQLITLENPLHIADSKEKLYDLHKNPNLFKNQFDLKIYDYNDTLFTLLQGMLVQDMTKRRTIEYIIESPILSSFDKLFMNVDQFQELIIIPKDKLLEIQYKIMNIKPLHDLVFYIIYNLKDFFLSIEEIMLFNEFYKFFDRNNDGLITFSEISEQLSQEKEDKEYAVDYTTLIMSLVDCEFRKRTTPSYQHNSITYNIFVTANILLRMHLSGYSEEIERNIEIMFSELDTDQSGTISIDEIQTVFRYTYDKNIKKVLDEIQNHELFDRDLIDNISSIKIEDFKSLLMYKVVKLKMDQQDEINRLLNIETNR